MATYERTETNRAKISFTISPAAIESGMQTAYNKNKNKFNIHGFRPGKAPRKIIEKMYGEMVFFEDGLDAVLSEEYGKAVEELDLYTVSRPEIDIENIDLQGEGVKLTAQVDLKPEVKLGKYLGVSVETKDFSVTDKDVDKEIELIREQNAGYEETDRKAELDDRVTIDYSGSIDGIKFDGGTAEGQSLDLGSNTFIPGFEEQITGMEKGETKDIKVTFPEDYRATDLAGKESVFTVTLHEIKEKQLPELDDEFAKDVSEFETLKELKADTKKKLIEQKEKQKKAYNEDMALKAAVDNANVEIPLSMIETQIDRQIQEMSYNLMYQGLNLEGYLQYSGMDMAALREEQRENAQRTVKSQLVLEAIINKENVQASDEKIDEYMAQMAERAKKNIEEYREMIGPEAMENIKDRIKIEAVIELIADNAKYTHQEGK